MAAELIHQRTRTGIFQLDRAFGLCPMSVANRKESKMPKLKTKSGAKKRLEIATKRQGKMGNSRQAPERDKADQEANPSAPRTRVMFKADSDNIIQYFLPNG